MKGKEPGREVSILARGPETPMLSEPCFLMCKVGINHQGISYCLWQCSHLPPPIPEAVVPPLPGKAAARPHLLASPVSLKPRWKWE